MLSYVYVGHLQAAAFASRPRPFLPVDSVFVSSKFLSFQHVGGLSDLDTEDLPRNESEIMVVRSSSRDEHNPTLNMVLAMDTGEDFCGVVPSGKWLSAFLWVGYAPAGAEQL